MTAPLRASLCGPRRRVGATGGGGGGAPVSSTRPCPRCVPGAPAPFATGAGQKRRRRAAVCACSATGPRSPMPFAGRGRRAAGASTPALKSKNILVQCPCYTVGLAIIKNLGSSCRGQPWWWHRAATRHAVVCFMEIKIFITSKYILPVLF